MPNCVSGAATTFQARKQESIILYLRWLSALRRCEVPSCDRLTTSRHPWMTCTPRFSRHPASKPTSLCIAIFFCFSSCTKPRHLARTKRSSFQTRAP